MLKRELVAQQKAVKVALRGLYDRWNDLRNRIEDMEDLIDSMEEDGGEPVRVPDFGQLYTRLWMVMAKVKEHLNEHERRDLEEAVCTLHMLDKNHVTITERRK